VAGHIGDIRNALLVRKKAVKDFLTFRDVGELLGVTHRRASQIARILLDDSRFVLCWHPTKLNTKIIRLNAKVEVQRFIHNVYRW
jgi:hypothetical protein